MARAQRDMGHGWCGYIADRWHLYGGRQRAHRRKLVMAYEQILAQINTNLGGLSAPNTAWGFPANTNFHTLLMSYWMCGPHAAPGYTGNPGIWPSFYSARFFGFGPDTSASVAGNPSIFFTNQAIWGATPYTGFFSGNMPPPQPTTPPACLQ